MAGLRIASIAINIVCFGVAAAMFGIGIYMLTHKPWIRYIYWDIGVYTMMISGILTALAGVLGLLASLLNRKPFYTIHIGIISPAIFLAVLALSNFTTDYYKLKYWYFGAPHTLWMLPIFIAIQGTGLGLSAALRKARDNKVDVETRSVHSDVNSEYM